MSVIFLLIPLSVLVAAGFLGAFIWAVRSGQYEDTCTPSMRMLLHDAPARHRRHSPTGGGGFADLPTSHGATKAKHILVARDTDQPPDASGRPSALRPKPHSFIEKESNS